MKKIICLTILIFGISLKAQMPDLEWAKTYGGSNEDAAYSIKQTTDSGFILVGKSESNDGDVIGNHGGFDFLVIKLDALGELEWQRSMGGSEDETAYSVEQTSDGGYIIAGESFSDDGDVTGHHGSTSYFDFWIVKLDSSGNLEWQKSLGGSAYDSAKDIQQTIDGGYLVVGRSGSNDGDVTGHHGPNVNADVWVVKLNSSGDIEWQKSYGGYNPDIAYSLDQTSDGNYIVAGTTSSSDGDVSNNHGNSDFWVFKIDTTGNIIWEKTFGGSSVEAIESIRKTTDGNYISAGYTNSINGDVSYNHGDADYWIVKIDDSGSLIWEKTFGGSQNDHAYSIQPTINGGFIVAGQSYSADGDITGHFGTEYSDYWVIKLNSTGEMEWEKSFGGYSGDQAKSIYETTTGDYIIAGLTYSTDGDVFENHGESDFWIVKLFFEQMSSGEMTDSKISLYPNPVKEMFHFSEKLFAIKIYNSVGKKVLSANNNSQLNLSQLQSGIYFLVAKNNKGKIVQSKFIKQ